MIRVISVKNGKLRLILTGDDAIDKETLKMADGATCKVIRDNLKVFDQSVSEGLVIEIDLPEQQVPSKSKRADQD